MKNIDRTTLKELIVHHENIFLSDRKEVQMGQGCTLKHAENRRFHERAIELLRNVEKELKKDTL